MKLIVKIIFSIVLFGITNTVFAQEFSDKEIGLDVTRITAKLKERGVEEKDIQQEISVMHDMYKQMYVEQKKQEKEILEKIKTEQKTTSTNRNILDIPQSEKDALQAFYNATNGPNWTNHTGWDFNTPVTSWNSTTQAGWYGVMSSDTYGIYELDLDNNNLTGFIPDEIGNLSKLHLLYLNNNSIGGTIPTSIGNLINLQILDLGLNNFNGQIPNSLSGLSVLADLGLYYNNLSGTIPSNLGSMTKLQFLRLMHNRISGVIPSELSQLSRLRYVYFYLRYNELSGNIPDLSENVSNSFVAIDNNRFRFVDFQNPTQFIQNLSRYSGYNYDHQQNTDTEITINSTTGGSVTFSMSADGPNRYTPDDTFQWYKGIYPNGVAVNSSFEINNRQLTLSNLTVANTGDYYCLSKHPQITNPANSAQNLILVREPIHLNVTNGTPLNACPETFEGTTFPPAGWAVYDNGVGTAQSWTETVDPTRVYAGAKSAFIDRENIGAGNTSVDWLVTSRFTVPANGELRFFTRQYFPGNNGSTYEVRVSTNPTQSNTAAFTPIQSWTETTLNTTYNVYEDKRVDLSAYPVGTQLYVAFVKTNTQPSLASTGDKWMIDNVRIVEKCQAPSILQVGSYSTGGLTQTSATLSWTNNGSATQWEVELVPTANNPTGVGTVTSSNPYTVNGLTPGTQYKFYVRAICTSCENNSSEWVGPFNFNTPTADYCPAPINLVVTNYNGISANVTWTENGTATSWQVLALPSFASGSPVTTQPTIVGTVVSQNSYVITGLDPNVEYKFFVRSICTSQNLSLWSSTSIINTNNISCTSNNAISLNIGNPGSLYVKELFINLINDIKAVLTNGGTINSSYNSVQLQALAPFITDANPGIYNFTGDTSSFSFSFSSSNHNDGMADVLISGTPTSGLLITFPLSTYYSPAFFMFNFAANFNGGSGKMNIRHINFCPNLTSCTKTNPLTATVKQLYLNLINKLMTLPTASVPNGFTCPELVALSPYITDANPAIYNFYNSANPIGNQLHFSFSNVNHNNEVSGAGVLKDISTFYENTSTPVADINLDTYFSSDVKARVLTTLSNGFIDDSKSHVKHINFCPTTTSCTATNPNSVEVNKLFTKLAQKLISKKLEGTTDANMNGITLPELTYLSHYISDNNPGIYNFTSTYNVSNQLTSIKFSFLPNETEHDVLIGGWQSSFVTANNYLFNLSDYESSSAYLNITDNLYNNILVKNIQVRHIEFCPDELWCKKHIAIVVDESGSIDESEARKIRKQLKNFIKEQANANFLTGSNTYVSLIGLSNTDLDTRTNHVIPATKILPSNIDPLYTAWINNYRQRDNTSANLNPGTSANSDYWNSGLKRALDEKADIVILITDGCQTANPAGLKATMARFNNNRTSTTDPHLYVIGLENGFYVDQSTVSNKTANLTVENDPNLNPELSRVDATSREAGFLRKSLKYLLNYGNTPEPLFPLSLKETLVDGSVVVRTFLTADYFGHDDFRFLGSEGNYIYNHLEETNITCGDPIPSQNCDDCFGYQPIPNKEYILSAWVKQDRNDQVIKYKIENPASGFIGVKLEFRKSNPDGTIDDNTTIGANPVYNIKCEPNANGEIIEGWQRIFKKFKVPSDAEFFNIILVNEDNGIPLYFDDIRIHPIDGSMKSFVYDPETYKLMSELDENNYSIFYEYDKEGGLIRVKKETAKGVKTIQETRSGNVLKE